MGTQAWFRNPHAYIRELVEAGEYRIAWDRGILVKKRLDPYKHAMLYFANALPWEYLTVGHQGTAHYTHECEEGVPLAVYPTWRYGESSDLLEDMLENPYGEDEDACNDKSVPIDERPLLGQAHKVVITELPPVNTGAGKSFFRYLKGLKEDYPDAQIHIHGLYSYKYALGMEMDSADIEPREAASKGRVHMPNGSIVNYERVKETSHWAKLLGFKPDELSVPRNRCIFNIKSAVWVGENYNDMFNFKVHGEGSGDYTSSDKDHVPATSASSYTRSGLKAADGDKMLCDTCSLQNNCKYFRSGAVCSVPGAEPVKLARMFNTRDADTIIDGLGTLMAANTNRLEKGMQWEELDGELSPEVSKMMGQVFDQGVKLAKLLEPQRFSPGSKVQVNVGTGGAAAVSGANPRQLVATVIRSLEQEGYKREEITSEMIQGALEGMISPDNQQRAISGTVVSSKEEEK